MRRPAPGSPRRWASARAGRNSGKGFQFGAIDLQQARVAGEVVGPMAGNPTSALGAEGRMEPGDDPAATCDGCFRLFARQQGQEFTEPRVAVRAGDGIQSIGGFEHGRSCHVLQ